MAVSKTSMSVVLLFLLAGDMLRAQDPVLDQGCSHFVYEYKLMERLLKLQLENASFKSKLNTLEKKMNSMVDTPAVAVKVGLFQDTNVEDGHVIKYERVITNFGGGYDVSEGVFVAPVTGTYVFTVTVCLAGSEWMRTKMIHNDAQIGFFMTGDANWETCNNDVATAVVQKGDRVWVEKESGTAPCLHENYGWNGFTANLLLV